MQLANKDLFRVDEVAEYFGVTQRTIRYWIEKKYLCADKIIGIVRIPKKSILELKETRSESAQRLSLK